MEKSVFPVDRRKWWETTVTWNLIFSPHNINLDFRVRGTGLTSQQVREQEGDREMQLTTGA